MGNCVKRETGFVYETETPDPQKINSFNYNYRIAPKRKEEFVFIEPNAPIEKPEYKKYTGIPKYIDNVENNDENFDEKNNKLKNSKRIFPDQFHKKNEKSYVRGDDHNTSFTL